MYKAILLFLAALLAVAIVVIGCFYIISPERMTGSFGLKPPASDAKTRADLAAFMVAQLSSDEYLQKAVAVANS